MKTIGFIGAGHMGQALIRAVAKTMKDDESILVSSRTAAKVNELKKELGRITVGTGSADVAGRADVVFICVNTLEVVNVINEIRDCLTVNTHLVTIAGGVTIVSIEKRIRGKISKVIPTLTCEVQRGTSLVCHNAKVPDEDRAYLEQLLGRIGGVLTVREEQFAVYTALSSCAPGLIASMFDLLVDAAAKIDGVGKEDAFSVILSSLEGTARLLHQRSEDFSSLVNRVARKGGNTEVGVELFRNNFPEVFDKMFSRMQENEQYRNTKTAEQFGAAG